MRIAILSNSELCIPLLSRLQQLGAEVFVFCNEAATANVLLAGFCRSQHVAMRPVSNPGREEAIVKSKPDILLVIDYDAKINVNKLKNIPRGLYNVHFSLLPLYRGASPVFWQMKNDEPKLGVTIHCLTEKIDAGDIFWQKSIPNESWYTYTIANQVLSQVAAEGVALLCNAAHMSIPLNGKPQVESLASVYKRPTLQDVVIDWNWDAHSIVTLIRACNDWNRGAIALLNGNEIKIVDAFVGSGSEKGIAEPGTIIKDEGMYITAVAGFHQNVCITAMLINQVFVPARFAQKFGIRKSNRFQHDFAKNAQLVS